MARKIAIAIVVAIALSVLVAMRHGSIAEHQRGMKVADIFALKSAFQINEYVRENNGCPEAIPGWESAEVDNEGRVFILIGNENGKYHVRYYCDIGIGFSVSVIYSFDSAKVFSRSEEGDILITYGHFTEPQFLVVKNRSEIGAAIDQTYE